MTQWDVLEYLQSNVVAPMGVDKASFFKIMLDPDETLDMVLRAQWKWAIYSRRVYGTPTFVMNGASLPATSGSWNVSQWRTFLQQYI